MMGQSWIDIMVMPYSSFQRLLSWKGELEEEKRKKMEEKISQLKSKQKTNSPADIIKQVRKKHRRG